jgi:signal transduction histidine kinase
MTIRTNEGRISALILIGSLVLIVNIFAYLLGRYSFVSVVHVGTRNDRLYVREESSKLALEIAEQNERFGIARDINELIIQKVAAVISLTEGGQYAAKVDPSSATRSLEKISQSARAAHTELRRLFDMLNKTHQVSAAPPGLRELEALVVLYRELGFNAYLRNEGKPFALNEGAQLALYRIVFDALENVKQNCPIGTDVSIDLSWVEDGMQVLIKDNGIEVANRDLVSLAGEDSGYTAEEDLKALTEPIVGKGITAMRERAALYSGSVEATKVPGVGFTVSAIFPHLKSLGAEQI